MKLFDTLGELGHEEVAFLNEPHSGLKCIIAIHSTLLGPALGGLRMWPYASEEDALRDVLRLSQRMTYATAIAGLDFGGGKAVLIGDPEADKSEALLRSLGRSIDALGGRYVTMEDVGTTTEDMDLVHRETECVVGVRESRGDPSPHTALGTYHGIRACLQRRFGHEDIGRVSFAVQGAGHVGHHLVRLLRNAGAKVFVTDINEERVEEVVADSGAEAVPMAHIYDTDAEVFAPCAMGGVINEDTVPRLRCQIVAGGANNQLESNDCATELERRGILYAPDYAINAGGLIDRALELSGHDGAVSRRRVEAIYTVLSRIFTVAEREQIPNWQAADRLAERRIAEVSRTRLPYRRPA
ncbi:MAG TPA: Glu/Leu/Phe/Val dehydrogenase dimerization domain-containing protein [Steroidobacteraceae bacterium]|nr:Glu/Leu/Phe/Val dehydrogenase dimerization domain-containing protein [Steroidobacteraceae bacterium]